MNLQPTFYLADDHELVAKGIASLISKILPLSRIVTFKNGELLFKECHSNLPDLIFLDYEMPLWDGKRTISELKKNFPSVPILILSMLNEKPIIETCISLGAIGFLNKDCSELELKHAIDSAFSGKLFYSQTILKSLHSVRKASPYNSTGNLDLTERELDVLQLLCDGLSPKEIGEKLFLSPRTVEKHKDNIMQKMGVSSVAKLISVALKNKLV